MTPFAQILARLKNVRQNFISLTLTYGQSLSESTSKTNQKTFNLNESSTNTNSASISAANPNTNIFFSINNQQAFSPNSNIQIIKEEPLSSSISSGGYSINKTSSSTVNSCDILEELDWCLTQLESMQSHKTISDVASTKFKKLLNKELSQFAEHNKSDNQIAEYIYSTYLHNEDIEYPEIKSKSMDQDAHQAQQQQQQQQQLFSISASAALSEKEIDDLIRSNKLKQNKIQSSTQQTPTSFMQTSDEKKIKLDNIQEQAQQQHKLAVKLPLLPNNKMDKIFLIKDSFNLKQLEHQQQLSNEQRQDEKSEEDSESVIPKYGIQTDKFEDLDNVTIVLF